MNASTRETEEGAASRAEPPQVDLEALADRVYELMRAELRLARARGQHIEKLD
jgi:hypothetical protein